MVKKSDILSKERTVTATEASRSFSTILTEVEAGATVHVVRRGVEVCTIAPPKPKGFRVSDILERLRGRPPVTLDDEFGKDLLEVINLKRPPRKANPWD